MKVFKNRLKCRNVNELINDCNKNTHEPKTNTPFPIRIIIEMVKMKGKDVENISLMWL